jgi:hypothetical protein
MLVEIFCEIDDFCKLFEAQIGKKLLGNGSGFRNSRCRVTASEVMTIEVYFHQSGYKNFKGFYEKHVQMYLASEFPHLVSYNRFVELRQQLLVPLFIYTYMTVQNNASEQKNNKYFIDSFSLSVSHEKRASSNKVFKNMAKKGKTSIGWFFGFKLHLIINTKGEIVAFTITSGNVSDNNEAVLTMLTKNLTGRFYGDKGYIVNPELFQKLFSQGIQFITKIRKNMKNKLMSLTDRLFLKKRGLIESVGSILKECLGLEHSRHRSVIGFFVHVFSTLAAYHFRPKKPSIQQTLLLA